MVSVCLLLYAVFISFKIFRNRGKWSDSINSFFSVKKFSSEKQFLTYFSRSFESTNVSFTTTFVGFFYLAQYNIMYGISIAIGFVFGIVVYAKYFIPMTFDEARNGNYFPEIISNAAGSLFAGKLIYAFLAFSMLMFYYTEVYGFFNVITNVQSSGGGISLYLVIVLTLAVMFFYIISGGYNNVIRTDSIQALLIRVGVTGLIILEIMLITDIGDSSSFLGVVTADFNIVEALLAVIFGIIAFLFAQVVYIENWQRIVIFLKSYDVADDRKETVVKNIQASLYKVSINLIIMYSVPIFMAVYSKSIGGGQLYEFLLYLWNYSLLYKILLTVSFIGFVSALYSTMDTYILAVLESLTRLFDITDMRKLQTVSFLAVFFVVPFMFLELDIRNWFEYIFLTYNIFAAPLIFALVYKTISKHLFIALTVVGFVLFTIIGLTLPDLLIPFNAVFVIITFLLTYFYSRRGLKALG